MKRLIECSFVLMICLMTAACYGDSMTSIIPQPVNIASQDGHFEINSATLVVADETAHSVASMFNEMFAPATGFQFRIVEDTDRQTNRIVLKLDSSQQSELGEEGYRLTVSRETVILTAPERAGLFYGLTTLKQLLGPEIFSGTKVDNVKWSLPCVTITDYPRFQWRGMHLDVCRHFMPKEFVKKYIDLIALHKMNVFHWHLTEDQGWRIEIKQYPKLTEVGAWRKETIIGHARGSRNTWPFDGTPHGGFYTQDDIREIVAYARDRFVTVVPEIEMPGHSQAAIAAYPELGNYDKQMDVCTWWGYGEDVFNVQESTITFLQNVLTEVMDLFPSKYIHIGGDEVPKHHWQNSESAQARMKELGLDNKEQLQSWFIKQMDTFLTEHNRRLVGWDEILEGGLAPGAVVMSWRGTEGGIAAAKSEHDVIMAPVSHLYFDYYQSTPEGQPLAIGGFTPLEKVYSFEPFPDTLTPEQTEHILGAQGQVWTEYILDPKHVEYMALPRMCALAEVVWTPAEEKDYDGFFERLTESCDSTCPQFVCDRFGRLDLVVSCFEHEVGDSPDREHRAGALVPAASRDAKHVARERLDVVIRAVNESETDVTVDDALVVDGSGADLPLSGEDEHAACLDEGANPFALEFEELPVDREKTARVTIAACGSHEIENLVELSGGCDPPGEATLSKGLSPDPVRPRGKPEPSDLAEVARRGVADAGRIADAPRVVLHRLAERHPVDLLREPAPVEPRVKPESLQPDLAGREQRDL